MEYEENIQQAFSAYKEELLGQIGQEEAEKNINNMIFMLAKW